MVEIINSLEDLCRLCAGKVDVLMGLHIFGSDHRQIFKKICVCLPIQVSVDDGYPKLICVECACKLDLMFEFRERSILTAHLFSEMITVDSSTVLTVEDNIAIVNENESNGYNNEDFVQCEEMDEKNMTSELNVELTNDTSLIEQPEESLVLEPKRYITKVKTKHKVRSKKKTDEDQVEIPENIDEFDDKKMVFSCDNSVDIGVFAGDNELSNCIIVRDEKVKLLKDETILESSQNSPSWVYCEGCDQSFQTREMLEDHENERGERCKFLGEADGGRRKLQRRVKKKYEEKQKKSDSKVCLDCGKQYQTNYKLQEHRRKHTGEKPYSCSYQDCKKAFRSKIGLAQHEANHSGQFEFNCSTCGKGFQCKSYLVVHQRVHSDLKPFTCKQCSRKFKTKQSLLDHMNRHLGVKPYLCDICGRGFITKGLCKSHQKVHSGTDNRQYPCHICRKLFVSKSYLNTHFRIHTGEKPFMCEVCGKGFLTRVDLRIHSTMHTGEKSFVCEICGKAFARRDALRCHRRSHTGERPYRCEFCGQSFTQFSPMAIHKRLHTGERPYECNLCTKSFVSRSTMLTHQKKHHPTIREPPFEFLALEVGQEEVTEAQDETSPEQLVVIEESPQLLSALSKPRAVEATPLLSPLKLCENATVIVE